MVGEVTAARDPLAQDVYDAVRLACHGGLTGGEIIAAMQEAIADSRNDEAVTPVVRVAA